MSVNWKNVGGWARTLGTVAAAIQAAAPADSKTGLYCAIAIAVSGEVVKQVSDPESWPQKAVVNSEPKP